MSVCDVDIERLMPRKKPTPRAAKRLSPTHLHILENRLDALGDRLECLREQLADLGVTDFDTAGHWGDLCAALLPEVYGEPSRLPAERTTALPGSEEKMRVLSERYGPKHVAITELNLHHPDDVKGEENGVEVIAGQQGAPRIQQHHDDSPGARAPSPSKPVSSHAGCLAMPVSAGIKNIGPFTTLSFGAYLFREDRLRGRTRRIMQLDIERRETAHLTTAADDGMITLGTS